MAQPWFTIIRQVLLRGNLLAGDENTLATDYGQTFFADVDITTSRAEYSFLALADALVQSLNALVTAIGANRDSEYRPFFIDRSTPLISGDAIPRFAAGSSTKERFGVIADVRDADNDQYCTEQPRTMIDITNRGSARRHLDLYQYFTDDIRVWHTRPLALAEFVAWDMEAERSAIVNSNDVSLCPLPDALLPDLETGALAKIYRDTFNSEAASIQMQIFLQALSRISAKSPAVAETAMKI